MDFCPTCQGIWLDQGELELLLNESSRKLDLSVIEEFSISKRRCPRCRRKMVRGDFPSSDVDVDICRRDLGIWLDRGEIIRIAEKYCDPQNFHEICRLFSQLFRYKSETKEA